MQKVNVAIIGTGLIANIHAQSILALGHRLKYINSKDETNAKAFAHKWAADSYGIDFERALANDIDCIHLCTPPTLHYEMAKAAIMAGKHIVSEKPLCTTAKEAIDLYQLAWQSQKINAVVFNVRFHKACVEAKEIIARSDFGDLVLLHGHYLQEFHALPDGYSWRYRDDLAGKMRATTEIGSHWLDLARYLSGLEITAVSASFHRPNPIRSLEDGIMHPFKGGIGPTITVPTEDIGTVTLRFSNGAIGNVVLSEISYGHTNTLNIEIVGTHQALSWNNENPYVLSHSQGKFRGFTQKVHSFGGGFSDTFLDVFSKIYADIQNGHPVPNPQYPTFVDGAINTLVCESIFESAQNESKWTKVEYPF